MAICVGYPEHIRISTQVGQVARGRAGSTGSRTGSIVWLGALISVTEEVRCFLRLLWPR